MNVDIFAKILTFETRASRYTCGVFIVSEKKVEWQEGNPT